MGTTVGGPQLPGNNGINQVNDPAARKRASRQHNRNKSSNTRDGRQVSPQETAKQLKADLLFAWAQNLVQKAQIKKAEPQLPLNQDWAEQSVDPAPVTAKNQQATETKAKTHRPSPQSSQQIVDAREDLMAGKGYAAGHSGLLAGVKSSPKLKETGQSLSDIDRQLSEGNFESALMGQYVWGDPRFESVMEQSQQVEELLDQLVAASKELQKLEKDMSLANELKTSKAVRPEMSARIQELKEQIDESEDYQTLKEHQAELKRLQQETIVDLLQEALDKHNARPTIIAEQEALLEEMKQSIDLEHDGAGAGKTLKEMKQIHKQMVALDKEIRSYKPGQGNDIPSQSYAARGRALASLLQKAKQGYGAATVSAEDRGSVSNTKPFGKSFETELQAAVAKREARSEQIQTALVQADKGSSRFVNLTRLSEMESRLGQLSARKERVQSLLTSCMKKLKEGLKKGKVGSFKLAVAALLLWANKKSLNRKIAKDSRITLDMRTQQGIDVEKGFLTFDRQGRAGLKSEYKELFDQGNYAVPQYIYLGTGQSGIPEFEVEINVPEVVTKRNEAEQKFKEWQQQKDVNEKWDRAEANFQKLVKINNLKEMWKDALKKSKNIKRYRTPAPTVDDAPALNKNELSSGGDWIEMKEMSNITHDEQSLEEGNESLSAPPSTPVGTQEETKLDMDALQSKLEEVKKQRDDDNSNG